MVEQVVRFEIFHERIVCAGLMLSLAVSSVAAGILGPPRAHSVERAASCELRICQELR